MLTMNPFIVFIMLFVPSLCEDPPEPDLGSPEKFLKEVNEYRAKTTPGPTTTRTPEALTTPKTTPKKPEASDEKKEKEGASKENTIIDRFVQSLFALIPLVTGLIRGFKKKSKNVGGEPYHRLHHGVPSLCNALSTAPPEPDLGSREEFLKEVNEYRAKFAKERRIPNMYKVSLLTEMRLEAPGRLSKSNRYLYSKSYRNMTEEISRRVNEFKEVLDDNEIKYSERSTGYLELLNPLQTFIECSLLRRGPILPAQIWCIMGSAGYLNFWYSNPGEAGSQCPPRFKSEDGLCVPVDPSKHTFWGTKKELLEDVNYMRRKYAKEFGIPNMHQLTWNESLIEILEPLNVTLGTLKSGVYGYLGAEDSSSWDGFERNWRITELRSFSAVVPNIDEAVHFVPRGARKRGNSDGGLELIHPLQTSIGCMEKRIKVDDKESKIVACLLGNMGQSSVLNFDEKKNKKKIPGSECMDGYVNDDGLCVLAPPTTTPEPTTTTPEATTTPKTTLKTTPKEAETVPASPMKPDASDEKEEKEGASVGEDAELEPVQEELESSVTTRIYSYGSWIFAFICLLF